MEYRLNRAAGFDGEDWTPFSRIINISWPGDTSSTDFMQAEFNAMKSGRRLVALLQQLNEAGIAVNIITHSLGARVALTALNILGTVKREPVTDHLFLWQPAVADNALTDSSEKDVHPLKLGVFPAAHQSAQKIVVLHSKRDGVLGPYENDSDAPLWRRMLSPSAQGPLFRFGHEVWRIANAEDPKDEVFARLHGAYHKKWWTFPRLLDNGLGVPLERLYQQYLPLTVQHSSRPSYWGPGDYFTLQAVEENWERLEEAIIAEAESLWDSCMECLRDGEPLPQYHLLSPLNHRAAINVQQARDYVANLRRLAQSNWFPWRSPRPALGYVGFDEVAGRNAGANRDDFIENMLDQERIQEVNQTDWLFSHSAMRVPNEEVFEKSFSDGIMRRIQNEGSGFGRY